MLLYNQQLITLEEQRNEILKHDIRFLLYEKHISGIADRFVHLLTTYLVAILTKRIFIFDKSWPEVSENFSKKIQWFSFDRYLRDYDYEKQFPERVPIFQGHTGGVIQTIDSNSSIYKKFLTENLQMNTMNLFGCLYHSLFTYKLSEILQRVSSSNEMINHLSYSSQDILRILLSPKYFPIGLQIRSGDEIMNEKSNNQILTDSQENILLNRFQNYFNCTLDLIHQNTKLLDKTGQIPIVFFISDNYQIHLAALKRWPFFYGNGSKVYDNNHLRIVSSSTPVLHIQYTKNRLLAFQLGLFDMFLFSLCQQHLISTDSGFGRIPAFTSLRQRNIYSLSLNEHKPCQNKGITYSTAGRHWSGI
ncbi:hypothetical protein I4U23_027050 [Adineta vaga]|nr:hypothetical protein I4U23_027050 [Adineta vaga]